MICEWVFHGSLVGENAVMNAIEDSGDFLIERSKTAIDSWEGKYSYFDRMEIKNMLEAEKFVPVGAGCLMLVLGFKRSK